MSQTEASRGTLAFDIHQNGNFLRTERLEADSVTIGRAESSNIQLDGDGVADLHAVIKVRPDGKIRLTDPGENGVTLDGESVDVQAVLPPRAEIVIGEFTLKFTFEKGGTGAKAPKSTKKAAAASAPEDMVTLAEQALKGDLAELLKDTWRRDDDLKVDDVKAKRVLEIREVWSGLLLDVQYFGQEKSRITVGEHHRPATDFFIPRDRISSDHFPLLERKADGWYLRFGSKFRGWIEVSEVQIQLEDLIRQGDATSVAGEQDTWEIRLTEDHRFVVAIGPDVLCGTFVHPSRAVKAQMDVDIPFMGMLIFLALFTVISITLLRRLPPPPEPTLEEMPDRFVQLLKKPPEPEKKPEVKLLEKTKAPEAAKEKEDEGKRGKQESKIEKAKGTKVALDKLKQDKKIAEDAGLLGALDKQDDMGGLFGGGLNSNISNAAGGLTGNVIGSQGGTGGGGIRGFGPGGGGSSSGIGGIGTRGGGPGGGGYGGGAGYKGDKKQANLDIGGSDVVVLGAIDPSLIDKAIREHTTQIRYCYSKELNKNPKLFGKVVIKFVIGPDGSVTSSTVKESTIDSVNVGTCVADRIQRITFPSPKGGGKVNVVYPFNFNAAG